MRFYSSIKGSFKKEQYIDFVPNRAQRSDLTRIRISASRLATETGRYCNPPIPPNQRYCRYCRPLSTLDNHLEGYIDTEENILLHCSTLTLKRNCFLSKLKSFNPSFENLSDKHKTATLLCPSNVVASKLVNKYLKIAFNFRQCLDNGEPVQYQGYENGVVPNEFCNDMDDDWLTSIASQFSLNCQSILKMKLYSQHFSWVKREIPKSCFK